MYYRYKTKKKDRKFLKLFLVSIILFATAYTAYQYRSRLMFWRVSHNRIVNQINQVSGITDPSKKVDGLRKLAEDIELYRSENPLEPDSYVYSSRVYYNLGLAQTGTNFSGMFIDDESARLTADQKEYFYLTIKELNKASALLDGKKLESADLFIFGKSCYFTGYRENKYIYNLLKPGLLTDRITTEDARFFSLLCMLEGEFDEGLEILEKNGGVNDSVEGRMYRALALKKAMKYTDSIIAFQNILKSTDEPRYQKLSYLNLGKIYFSQNLFRESLEQFNAALSIDPDVKSKIWIGRCFAALGQKANARNVWSEALVSDPDNEELKKLLAQK